MVVVKDVCKKFNDNQVLDKISFHISPNECTAILGKNGAGKTTLLNIISGTLKADSGFVRLNMSRNPLKDFKTLKKISYVSGIKSMLDKDMKLIYSFDNCRMIYGIERNRYKKRLLELAKQFEIEDCLDCMVYQLSLGQRVRSELVCALLSEPEILFLDEALIGLDVTIKEKILKILYDIKSEGKTTIIYTSHNLFEVERLCDRIILIDGGRIIFDGSIDTVYNEFSPEYRIDFEIEGRFPDLEDLPVERYMMDNRILSVMFQRQKVEAAVIIKHVMGRCTVKNIKMSEPDIEDTVKKILMLNDERMKTYD